MLRISLAKALGLTFVVEVLSMPITAMALLIISGSLLKFVIDSSKALSKSCSQTGRSVSGIILIVIELTVARRRIISVAKRVHRLSFLGKGISVSASRTELLPDDWSPHTTSWGSDKMLSRPHLRTWATV